MSDNESDELRSIGEVFDNCPDCGAHVVRLAAHRCSTANSGTTPTRERRRDMASVDPRPDSTVVGIFQRPDGNVYAYHDVDDGDPLCGCDSSTKTERFQTISLSRARERGRSPCGNCRRIREL